MSNLPQGGVAHRAEAFGGILLHIATERMLIVSAPQYAVARALLDGPEGADPAPPLAAGFGLSEVQARRLVEDTRALLGDPGRFTSTPVLLRNFTDHISAPINVVWEITGNCNLRCSHCFVPAEDHVPTQIGPSDLLRVAEALVRSNVLVVRISGGEPMRHPALEEILETLKSTPRHIKLLTNGTVVNDRAVALVARHVDSLSVSLDGASPAAHDRIRGVPGAFERTIAGLRRLRSETSARINVTTSVFRDNLDEIAPIIDLCLAIGIHSWKYTLALPIGRAATDRSLLPLERDVAQLARVLEPYRGNPVVAPAIELLDAYIWSEPQPTWCGGAFDEVAIDPAGHLYPCAYTAGLRSYNAGNVLKSDLGELYQGEMFRTFRGDGLTDLSPDCKAVRLAYRGTIEPAEPVYRPEALRALLDGNAPVALPEDSHGAGGALTEQTSTERGQP